MPSTVGLGQAIRESSNRRCFTLPSGVHRGGDLVLSADLLAQAGLDTDDELIGEIGPDGLHLRADALRKVYVEVTSACNLACAICIRRTWDEPLGHMPLARFQRLLDGLPARITSTADCRRLNVGAVSSAGAPRPVGGAVRKAQKAEDSDHASGSPDLRVSVSPYLPIILSLSGFGEPLVHPHFLELVRLARERGARVEIITNGTLLDVRMARELVALDVARVTVSLDGGDEIAYTAMRGHAQTPAVEALNHLLETRRRARRPTEIGVAFVAAQRNIGSLPRLLALAHDLGLDFVSVSNVVPHTPEMAAEMLWSAAAWAASFPDASWRPRLELARMALDDQSRSALASLLDHGPTWPHPGTLNGPQRNRCRFAHEGMLAVAWDGRVAPCLSLLHTHSEYVNDHWKTVRSFTVGHVDEQPLSEIWRDPAYREFRRRVREFDFSACFACGGCPLTDTNETDCYSNPFPACGECLWAQGIVLCP